MKNIKKWIVVALAAILCVGMTACVASPTASMATLENSATPEEGKVAEEVIKDPAGYDDDIQGLCKYMEDCKVTAGDREQMSYDVIGAKNGYKYAYLYNGSSVQLELYEFATENIPEAAQDVIASVREKGTFHILDHDVPATLSADGRFMMIHTDAQAEKQDLNKAHKAHVDACFEEFTAE